MATLTATTVVTHPDSGQPVALIAGDALPDWADGLVGDHLLKVESDAGPYDALQKKELLAEVARRNADRDEAERILPESEKNADLIAALVADDAASEQD